MEVLKKARLSRQASNVLGEPNDSPTNALEADKTLPELNFEVICKKLQQVEDREKPSQPKMAQNVTHVQESAFQDPLVLNKSPRARYQSA